MPRSSRRKTVWLTAITWLALAAIPLGWSGSYRTESVSDAAGLNWIVFAQDSVEWYFFRIPFRRRMVVEWVGDRTSAGAAPTAPFVNRANPGSTIIFDSRGEDEDRSALMESVAWEALKNGTARASATSLDWRGVAAKVLFPIPAALLVLGLGVWMGQWTRALMVSQRRCPECRYGLAERAEPKPGVVCPECGFFVASEGTGRA